MGNLYRFKLSSIIADFLTAAAEEEEDEHEGEEDKSMISSDSTSVSASLSLSDSSVSSLGITSSKESDPSGFNILRLSKSSVSALNAGKKARSLDIISDPSVSEGSITIDLLSLFDLFVFEEFLTIGLLSSFDPSMMIGLLSAFEGFILISLLCLFEFVDLILHYDIAMVCIMLVCVLILCDLIIMDEEASRQDRRSLQPTLAEHPKRQKTDH